MMNRAAYLLTCGKFLAELGRRGFLHGFWIPLLWLLGSHKLWFSSFASSCDTLLFSDSWGLPSRMWPVPHSFLLIALVAGLIHLVWMAIAGRSEYGRIRIDLLLPGIACALAVYGGISQIGAAMSTARRMDPPLHYMLQDGVRWIGFMGLASWILVYALRSAGVEAVKLRKGLRFLAVIIGLSALSIALIGKYLVDLVDWRDAKSIGSAYAYNGYLKAHPKSRHLEEARRRTWSAVLARPDLSHIRCYLEHAKDWGDRLDSAKLLESKLLLDLRRTPFARVFSGDSLINAFWKNLLPDTLGPYRGARIVRYQAVLERVNPSDQATRLGRSTGRRIMVPDSGFDFFECSGRNRLVEEALDSVVRCWVGPQLVTIAPWKESDTDAPDLVVRLGVKFTSPLEPIPCGLGCPPEKERWMLPSIAYSWQVEFHPEQGHPFVRSSEIVDTSFAPDDGIAAGCEEDENCRWKYLDLEGAWQRRKERSQAGIAWDMRREWSVLDTTESR